MTFYLFYIYSECFVNLILMFFTYCSKLTAHVQVPSNKEIIFNQLYIDCKYINSIY